MIAVGKSYAVSCSRYVEHRYTQEVKPGVLRHETCGQCGAPASFTEVRDPAARMRDIMRDIDMEIDAHSIPMLALEDLRAARKLVASALDKAEGRDRDLAPPTKRSIEAAIPQRLHTSFDVYSEKGYFRVEHRDLDRQTKRATWGSGPELIAHLVEVEQALVARGFDAYRIASRVEVRA